MGSVKAVSSTNTRLPVSSHSSRQRAQDHRANDNRDMQGGGLDEGEGDQADAGELEDQLERHEQGDSNQPAGVVLTGFHKNYLLLPLRLNTDAAQYLRGRGRARPLSRIIQDSGLICKGKVNITVLCEKYNIGAIQTGGFVL